MTYRNSFNWTWVRELTGSTLKWSASIKTSDFNSPKTGDPLKPLPLMPTPAPISLATDAKADSPGGYWGYEDLPGPLALANGPSVSGSMSGGQGKIASGGVITLVGGGGSPPGGLQFTHIAAKPSLGAVGKPKDAKAEFVFTVTLVEGAVGGVVGGETMAGTPELEPRAVAERKTFKYVITGFETGKADVPIASDETRAVIDRLKRDVEYEKVNFDTIRDLIAQAGENPVTRIAVNATGYASRRWTEAGLNEAMRQQKNVELSEKRAREVLSEISGAVGPEAVCNAIGMGASVIISTEGVANLNDDGGWVEPGRGPGVAVPEGNTAEIEQRRAARRQQLRVESQYSSLTPEQQKKQDEMIENQLRIEEQANARISDVPNARRVEVELVWDGFKIEWAGGDAPQMTSRTSTEQGDMTGGGQGSGGEGSASSNSRDGYQGTGGSGG